jgi:hypothetical protein
VKPFPPVPPGSLLAFDVGPKACGVAALDAEGRVLAVGEVESTAAVLAALVEAVAPSRMAVEWVAGHAFSPARVPGLVASAAVAGQLLQLAHAAGVPCACITAAEWRRAIVGKPAPRDGEVADALAGLVELPKRTNAHVRDAVGLALAARLAAGLTVTPLALSRAS